VFQSYNNRERCIEMLAKECQKYQTSMHNRPVMTSSLARHSSEDLWQQQNYDSSESISSVSSGNSVGAPSSGYTNLDIAHPHIRTSQSYPYIPPSRLSGRVHDSMPRSSLPNPSLDTVPPSHGRSPATAAVMQYDPFNFRPDSRLNRSSAQNAAEILVPVSYDQYPSGVLGQCSLPGGSPNSLHTSKLQTVTSEVRYRINPSGVTGELAGPTYLSTTSVNMLAPEEGGSVAMSVAAHETQTRLSYSRFHAPVSSRHSSNVFINPQQVLVSSPQMPKTYVSSLSSSCEFLPSVTGAEAAIQPSLPACIPARCPPTVSSRQNSNSPRPSIEDVDSPEYIHGM